ncbi:hypothetical protein [Kribbella sp. NPDC006257]|uniref:hypothetical protein n=1 Tax=Kribbella sp. NPDC006257 TaxID=3156738 RepID=UPI0033B8C588
MNLEQKLTEALDAAARTVPDTAEPPPVLSPTPRRRPLLIAALAAAAVLAAVAVPVLISHNDDKGQVTGGICPAPPAVQLLKIQQQNVKPDFENLNEMPFGSAPKVPFTMAKDAKSGGGYLEDLGVRVPLENGLRYSTIGRTACGWVVLRGGVADYTKAEIGRLSTSGEFTSFGQLTGDGMFLSPDGTELVYVSPAKNGTARIRVVEVATGKEAASYPTDPKTEVVGWNPAGIWFEPAREATRTSLWNPGSDPVPIDTLKHRLTAYRGTDRMLLSDQVSNGADNCVRVVVLDESHRLRTLQQKCGSGKGSLSPDGKVLLTEGDTTEAYLVDTGARTRLHASPLLVGADYSMLWDDQTHVLSRGGIGNDRVVTLRCDVISGICERISDGLRRNGPAGPSLGSP